MLNYNFPVVIVLSTFNGERYLKELLDSLLNQTYKNIRIIVRDDGSEDGTSEILNNFSRENKSISVIEEKNVGVVESFFRLIELVPADAEFVAFCDQDDVWDDDKIERAVSLIQMTEMTIPVLYCGALKVVDKNLNLINIERQVKRSPLFENALVQNVATGCTIVINKPALRLVKGKDIKINMVKMHDWWLYQLMSSFGLVLFDDIPKINYRQHGANVVGSSSGIKLWGKRVKRFLKGNSLEVRCQAMELLRVYGPGMCRKNLDILTEFLEKTQMNNIVSRFMYAIRTPVYRQSFIDDLILRIFIVLARI